jgi:hypothetical protein
MLNTVNPCSELLATFLVNHLIQVSFLKLTSTSAVTPLIEGQLNLCLWLKMADANIRPSLLLIYANKSLTKVDNMKLEVLLRVMHCNLWNG